MSKRLSANGLSSKMQYHSISKDLELSLDEVAESAAFHRERCAGWQLCKISTLVCPENLSGPASFTKMNYGFNTT